MILIFKATKGFTSHNRDNIVAKLGQPAIDGDTVDFDPGEAEVLLNEFPNNWFDYKEMIKQQEADTKKKQADLRERLKSSNVTSSESKKPEAESANVDISEKPKSTTTKRGK